MICNDVVREPGASGYLCDADVGTKIYWVRGAAVLLFFAGVGILAAWAVVVYRPRITMDARSDAAARALMKERMQKADDAFQAGDYSKALSFLQGALRRDPGNEEFLYKTGLCFERLAKPAKAQEYFYLAAKEDKAYPPALLKMAGYMYSKGILGRAGRYAQRAVEAKVADLSLIHI